MKNKIKQAISKTKIERRMRTKRNPILVNTIVELKKSNPAIAKLLVRPVKKMGDLNLSEIDRKAKDGETVLVVGKVLSSGDLTKKLKIVAWSASEKAKEKMKASKSEFVTIVQEMKKNKELKGVKLIE
jgi:large subunit ribosomal protein L18e